MRIKTLLNVLLLLTLCTVLLSGCGNSAVDKIAAEQATTAVIPSVTTTAPAATQPAEPVPEADIDLTKLSSTMVYSQVNDMVTNPGNFIGKVVHAKGQFSLYQDTATGKNYYACVIADATACCQQGIEFVRKGEFSYPADYPEIGKQIEVTGTFNTYMEGTQQYCQLENAVMTVVS